MNDIVPSDFNLNISTHNFNEAKAKIKDFAQSADETTQLSKVDTSSGPFGWFNHKVTGDELNKLTTQLQTSLIDINTRQVSIIKEFDNIYQTFEYLDKDYLSGIVIALKSAEKNKAKSDKIQADLKKSVDEQKRIIAVLKKHKEKLEKIEHLMDVDEIWSGFAGIKNGLIDTNQHIDNIKEQLKQTKNDISGIIQEFSSVSETIESNVKKTDVLFSFKQKIENLNHIYDTDKTWNKVASIEKNIGNIQSDVSENLYQINKINDKVTEIGSLEHIYDVNQIYDSVKESTKFINELKKQTHLYDIDKVWDDISIVEKSITDAQNDISNNLYFINEIKDALKLYEQQNIEFISYINCLKNQMHLNDIDEIWNMEELNKKEIDRINGDLTSFKGMISNVDKEINDTKQQVLSTQKEFENYKNTSSLKIRIAVSIACLSLAGTIGEFLWFILR